MVAALVAHGKANAGGKGGAAADAPGAKPAAKPKADAAALDQAEDYKRNGTKPKAGKVQLGYADGEGGFTDIPDEKAAAQIVAARDAAVAAFDRLGVDVKGLDDIKIVAESNQNRAGAYATGQGFTHRFNQESEKEFDRVYAESAESAKQGEAPAYAFKSLEDRMIHEISHNIGRNLPAEDQKELERLYGKFGGNLDHLPSAYAQENPSEMWAESVLAVVRGYKFGGTARGYGPQDKELEDFVRSKLGISSRADRPT
jgi:hypothetical protein